MRSIFKLSIPLLTIAWLFSGCMTKTIPATKHYTLEAATSYDKKSAATQDLTIKVLEPITTKIYNTHFIHYSDKAYQTNRYIINKWSTYPTKMLEKTVAQKLDESKLYTNVLTSMINGRYDYILQGELISMMQTINNGSSTSTFSIKYYLLNSDNQNIASKTFTYTIQNSQIDAYSAVVAYNKAVDQLITDLFDWMQINTK